MADSFRLAFGQGIQAVSGTWYKNLQVLGRGGNAVTFLAIATSGSTRGVPFAIKVFQNLDRPERRESFLHEIDFLRSCDHPSIMRVFDTGVFQDKYPFVVAEYLPQTLRSVIRAQGASMVEKVSYTLQLLSALDYLANREPPVIHRDIKPENIFLKGQSCVLGDFGLLKRASVDLEIDREVLKESIGAGMPRHYRTPDLVAYLQGEAYPTAKSDVFQLGLVVAELFTGQNPVKPAADFRDPVELRPLERISGTMGSAVVNLIQRMLIEDPAQREPASKLINPWQGILLTAAKRTQDLEGRVFGI